MRFIEKVLDSFEYDKLFYVDCSTFHSFFKILINDYEEYVSDRNKSVNKIRIEHNVNNINLGYSTRMIKKSMRLEYGFLLNIMTILYIIL